MNPWYSDDSNDGMTSGYGSGGSGGSGGRGGSGMEGKKASSSSKGVSRKFEATRRDSSSGGDRGKDEPQKKKQSRKKEKDEGNEGNEGEGEVPILSEGLSEGTDEITDEMTDEITNGKTDGTTEREERVEERVESIESSVGEQIGVLGFAPLTRGQQLERYCGYTVELCEHAVEKYNDKGCMTTAEVKKWYSKNRKAIPSDLIDIWDTKGTYVRSKEGEMERS